MKLHQLKSTMERFLTSISAVICAMALLMISVMYITINMQQGRKQFSNVIPVNGDNAPWFFTYLTAYLFILFVGIHCGVALGRFVFKAAPLYPSGRIRYAILTISLVLPAWYVFDSFVFFVRLFTSDNSLNANIVILLGPAIGRTLWLFWITGFALVLIKYHLRPLAFQDRPFILFLRRFSTFSDRMVVSMVIRQAPAGYPVVFLAPVKSRPGDWNPFLIGFAGMRFFRPLHSGPIILRAMNADWENVARQLIVSAQKVIIDVSEEGGSIETELELINQTGNWHKTTCIKEFRANSTHEFGSSVRASRSEITYYRKSWIRGIPRMLIGLYVITFVLIPFFVALQPIESTHLEVTWICLISLLLMVIWLYISFFVRPSIDRESKLLLKEILVSGLS
jgi:hypothetical protein